MEEAKAGQRLNRDKGRRTGAHLERRLALSQLRGSFLHFLQLQALLGRAVGLKARESCRDENGVRARERLRRQVVCPDTRGRLTFTTLRREALSSRFKYAGGGTRRS